MTRAVRWCLMRVEQDWSLNLGLNFLNFEGFYGPRDLFQNCSFLDKVCYSLKNSLALRIIHFHTWREGQEGSSVTVVPGSSWARTQNAGLPVLLPPSSPRIMEHGTEYLVTSPSCFVTTTHDLGSLYLSRERGGETIQPEGKMEEWMRNWQFL